jgi:hypothetical protein
MEGRRRAWTLGQSTFYSKLELMNTEERITSRYFYLYAKQTYFKDKQTNKQKSPPKEISNYTW